MPTSKEKTNGYCVVCGKRYSIMCGIRMDHLQAYSKQWKKKVIYHAEEYIITIYCSDCHLYFEETFDHFYYYNRRLTEIRALMKKCVNYCLEPLVNSP